MLLDVSHPANTPIDTRAIRFPECQPTTIKGEVEIHLKYQSGFTRL